MERLPWISIDVLETPINHTMLLGATFKHSKQRQTESDVPNPLKTMWTHNDSNPFLGSHAQRLSRKRICLRTHQFGLPEYHSLCPFTRDTWIHPLSSLFQKLVILHCSCSPHPFRCQTTFQSSTDTSDVEKKLATPASALNKKNKGIKPEFPLSTNHRGCFAIAQDANFELNLRQCCCWRRQLHAEVVKTSGGSSFLIPGATLCIRCPNLAHGRTDPTNS